MAERKGILMQRIPLARVANQKFSITLDQVRYEIQIQQCTNVMGITIKRNGVLVVSGQRCLPNNLVIPYQYAENAEGNFAFDCLGDQLPAWENFGITQNLYYVTNAELAVVRNG